MNFPELISPDHAILRRGLDILDGMVKKLEDGERIEIADVTAILKFLRFFGEQAIVADIEAALNHKRGIAFVHSSRRLILLLRDHLGKEDTFLPDIVDRSPSKEAETVINFTRLENKYMRKPQETPLNSGREIA
jgi:hemerythrin-like domain-containing protein